MARHRANYNDSAHLRDGAEGGPSVISKIDTVKSRAVRAQRSRAAEISPDHPSSGTVSPKHQRGGGEVFLGTELVKNGANIPLEQQHSFF